MSLTHVVIWGCHCQTIANAIVLAWKNKCQMKFSCFCIIFGVGEGMATDNSRKIFGKTFLFVQNSVPWWSPVGSCGKQNHKSGGREAQLYNVTVVINASSSLSYLQLWSPTTCAWRPLFYPSQQVCVRAWERERERERADRLTTSCEERQFCLQA